MRTSSNKQSAAVLLEVVLALLLFVATVAVVSGVLTSSMTAMERQRAMMHAANLAVTVHSEIDLGLRPATAQGAQEFGSEFPGWTVELTQVSGETEGAMTAVEVIVRSTNSPAVYRLTQAHRARVAEVAR